VAATREKPPTIAPSVDFAYVMTKVRGRHRKLYEGDRLTALTRLRSLGDVGQELLGQREFVDHLDLERHIVHQHVRQLLDITGLVAGQRRDLTDWLITRYLAENVKVLVRGFAAGEPVSAMRPFLVDLPRPFALDLEDLAKAANMSQLVQKIPVPELAESANEQLPKFAEGNRSFFIEAGIDRAYYEGLGERLERLAASDRTTCTAIIEADIAMYNVLAALRGRFTYGLLAEQMQPLLALRAGAGLRGEVLRVLAAANMAGGIAAVPRLLVGHTEQPLRDAADVETAMLSRLQRIATTVYYTTIFELGVVVGFFYIKRVELLNLIRIVEMVRLKLSAEEMVRKLVYLR
jgi:vacuolar-type H+-ATPase subunit C/Vma6